MHRLPAWQLLRNHIGRPRAVPRRVVRRGRRHVLRSVPHRVVQRGWRCLVHAVPSRVLLPFHVRRAGSLRARLRVSRRSRRGLCRMPHWQRLERGPPSVPAMPSGLRVPRCDGSASRVCGWHVHGQWHQRVVHRLPGRPCLPFDVSPARALCHGLLLRRRLHVVHAVPRRPRLPQRRGGAAAVPSGHVLCRRRWALPAVPRRFCVRHAGHAAARLHGRLLCAAGRHHLPPVPGRPLVRAVDRAARSVPVGHVRSPGVSVMHAVPRR